MATRISLPSRSDVPAEVARVTRTESPDEPSTLRDLHVQTNIDAVKMEKLKQSIGDIFVLARKQLWSTLQNRDTASEADECLREFQANIAAAQYD